MGRRGLNYSDLISEEESFLKSEQQKKSQPKWRWERLEFLRLLKSGTCKTQAAASTQIGLKARQGQNLWMLYSREGLKGLLGYGKGKGRKSYLTDKQESAVLEWLSTDQCITQGQLIAYIHQTFQVRYSHSGISRKLKALQVKAKTGRPVNVRKDHQGAEDFKKNSLT
jgi:transposase